jgi:hypothetical protein
METVQEMSKLPELYDKLSYDAAIKEAEFKNLEEQRKVILAGIKNRAKKENLKATESALERVALCSEEYGIFMNGYCESRHRYLVSKAALNALEVKIDILRSKNSYDVARIKLL